MLIRCHVILISSHRILIRVHVSVTKHVTMPGAQSPRREPPRNRQLSTEGEKYTKTLSADYPRIIRGFVGPPRTSPDFEWPYVLFQ